MSEAGGKRGDQPSRALFAFFERLPRQGPGSAALTRALFERVRPDFPPEPRAADMGCGSGAAGLVLAEAGAHVVGVDIYRPYLDAFLKSAADRGHGARVEVVEAGMTTSGLAPASLDLVWCEGAAFTVGFDAALEAFHDLLRPGGFAVISELMWLQRALPDYVRGHWAGSYPAMRSVAGNLDAAESAGWRFVHAETLPAEAWENSFFEPMEAVIAEIERDGPDDLRQIADQERGQIDLFRRHGEVFGYVYLVLARPARADGGGSAARALGADETDQHGAGGVGHQS